MTSVQIRALLQGPDNKESINYAINALNSSFPSLRHVNSGTLLADSLNEGKANTDAYDSQVRLSTSLIILALMGLHPRAASHVTR